MKTILCTNNESLAKFWQESLRVNYIYPYKAGDKKSLYEHLQKSQDEDTALLLDDNFAGDSFEELKSFIKELLEYKSDLVIMVLSQYPNFSLGKNLLSIGIKAYANARMLSVHFTDALSAMQKGDIWVYPEFVQMMIRSMNDGTKSEENSSLLELLSPREKEIASLIYQGHSNKEIALMADITLRTVKAHTSSIYEKLRVKDRVALVLKLKNLI